MSAPLLQDLVVVVAVAAAMTVLFHRLRQPVVLGYLLAGILIGPHTPPFSLVTDKARIGDLAELGLIFLMFALGLEFNLRKLRQHGGKALIMAFIEVTLMLALGYGAGRALGWSVTDSLFLGAIISSTSTTILAKVLQEMGLIKEEFAQAALAVTIIEDIFVLLLAVYLEGIGGGAPSTGLLLTTLARVAVFVLMVVSIGLVTVPRLIDWVNKQHVEELMVVAVVGVAFVGAFVASILGFSLALGAFLAGTLVSESRAASTVGAAVAPIRDLFASTFFVAVGMLLDPRLIWEHLELVLLISALALGGKFIVNFLAAWLTGHEGATSARIGVAMAQMGEWSLIVAALGVTLGVTGESLYPIAVGACSLTMFLAPHLLKHSARVARVVAERTPGRVQRVGRAYRRTLRSILPGGSDARSRRDAPHRHRIALYAAWIIGLFLAAAALLRWLEASFPTTTIAGTLGPAAGLLIVGLIGLPLLLVFGHEMSLQSARYAKRYHLRPSSLSRQDVLSTRAIRLFAVIVAPIILYLAGLAIASITIHPIHVPSAPLLLLVGGLLGAASIALFPWRRRLHAWFTGTLELMLHTDRVVSKAG